MIPFRSIAALLSALVFTLAEPARGTQVDIPAPADSGNLYADSVVVLPNGNIVVTDPSFSPAGAVNAGAVYLLDGATLNVISTLRGSSTNDAVGGSSITVLSNGNFVVRSYSWNGNRGAVTWGSATTGFIGGANVVVSATNSLVGSTEFDGLGSSGIAVLSNGNYVVGSAVWDNGAAVDAGAATWGNGSTGVVGTVSAGNSLVGTTTNDFVASEMTVLTNGNYIVGSPKWSNGAALHAGAATWCNGSTGTAGVISETNSLIGSTHSDHVGFEGITALANGNYVVNSQYWNNGEIIDAGAVTWGNGNTGVTGVISPANSLVGTTANENLGNSFSGTTALTNGNYVVAHPKWNNGRGAVTWVDGSVGMVGTISAANSLVGSTTTDEVGSRYVAALGNGNYVVSSPLWDNGAELNAGAVTWGNGATGTAGVVSAANSLVGSVQEDQVGSGYIFALTNDHYVVASPKWNNGAAVDAGAVTWGNGNGGTVGAVSVANSLVGSSANDLVGGFGSSITKLTNGNYVVTSSVWDNGAVQNVGAVTWGNGTTGTVGVISDANSLVGSVTDDMVGSRGVTALSNGNYVVASPDWNNGAAIKTGAATWGNGTTGTAGAVSDANSIVGSATKEMLGYFFPTALANGDYLVVTRGGIVVFGPSLPFAALRYGNGRTGGSVGPITSANGLVGTLGAVGDGNLPNSSYRETSANFDPIRNRVLVGRGSSKLLTILSFAPVVSAPTASGITETEATLGGNVTANDGDAITERGIVFAPIAADIDPLMGDAGVTKLVEGGTTLGAFTQAVSGLTPGTTYSFKAYAINSYGVGYSSWFLFGTKAPPSVTTNPAEDLRAFRALLSADVNTHGYPTTLTLEFSTDPTFSNSHTYETEVEVPWFFPHFQTREVFFAGLFPNTQYYFRSSATNQLGTVTGETMTFTTTDVHKVIQEQGTAAPGRIASADLPDDAVIARFNLPATSDGGDVAFIAKWSSTTGPVKRGTGLFLNDRCLAVVGGDASAVGGAGAKWVSFTDPVVKWGKLACIAKLSTGGSAVVSNFTGAALEKIALIGEDAPGAGDAKFKSFTTVALHGGSIGFSAKLSGGTGTDKITAANDSGLWARDSGGALGLIFRDGFSLDGGRVISAFSSFQPGVGSPGFGRGWLSYKSGALMLTLNKFTDKSQTVGFGGFGGYTFVAKAGEAGTNFGPAVAGASFDTFRFPAMNDSLEQTFYATMKVGAGGVTKATAGGIFTAIADFNSSLAPSALIARTGSNAGTTGGKFSTLKDPVISQDGDIAFAATIKGGTVKGHATKTLWWKPAGQPLYLLAQGGKRPGLDLPATAQWKEFTNLAIAGRGRGPIFTAKLVAGKGGITSKTDTGVWAVDYTGAVRTLFRTGDTIGGKTLKSFSLLKVTPGNTGVTRSVNDDGQVIWLATFTDGTTAIITTEVP